MRGESFGQGHGNWDDGKSKKQLTFRKLRPENQDCQYGAEKHTGAPFEASGVASISKQGFHSILAFAEADANWLGKAVPNADDEDRDVDEGLLSVLGKQENHKDDDDVGANDLRWKPEQGIGPILGTINGGVCSREKCRFGAQWLNKRANPEKKHQATQQSGNDRSSEW